MSFDKNVFDKFDTATQHKLDAMQKLFSYRANCEKMLRMHQSNSKIRLILGGKRSGKTTFGIMETSWAGLGTHPFLDYPEPPLTIRVCSVDFISGVKGIVLPMYYAWLGPQGGPIIKKFWAEDRLLEFHNGTIIDFKSYDQDLDKFEGVGRHLIWMDEEPPKDKYQSNYMRTIAANLGMDPLGGKMVITCTPLYGMCFDEETEILTKRGWAHYNEFQENDQLLTFNKDKRILEWLNYDLLYVNTGYNGPMVGLTCQGFDALVTPDHRWPIIVKATNELKVVQTKDLGKHQKIFRAAEYNGCPIKKTYSDDFVRLIGWIITEGTFRVGRHEIRISQSLTKNPEKCVQIRNLFKSIFGTYKEKVYNYNKKLLKNGWKEYPNSKGIFFIGRGPWADTIRLIIPNKELTSEFLLSLTKDQLWILYETLLLGDGHRNKNGDDFTQNFGDTIENFQMLCVLLGLESTLYNNWKNSFRVHVSRSKRYKPFTHVCSLQKEEIENYKGIIWCPHTKNETVVARRNGTVYITSQTWLYDDLYDNSEAVPPYVEHAHVSIYDNPHLNKESIDAVLKDPAMRDNLDAAIEGKFIAKSGLIYGQFSESHIIKPVHPIPDDWLIVLGIDPHDRNPHGIVFCALTKENVWVVFDEILEQCVLNELVARIKIKLGKDRWPPNLAIIDTSGNAPQSLTGTSVSDTLKQKYGLYVMDAHKDIQSGRLKVSQLLDPGPGLKPKLYVTENCRQLIREFRHYIWDNWARYKDKMNPKERPLKKDDHLLDALRYVLMANIYYRHPKMAYERTPPDHMSRTTAYF